MIWICMYAYAIYIVNVNTNLNMIFPYHLNRPTVKNCFVLEVKVYNKENTWHMGTWLDGAVRLRLTKWVNNAFVLLSCTNWFQQEKWYTCLITDCGQFNTNSMCKRACKQWTPFYRTATLLWCYLFVFNLLIFIISNERDREEIVSPVATATFVRLCTSCMAKDWF